MIDCNASYELLISQSEVMCVCICVCVCLCVCSHISAYECGSIVTKLYIEIAGYDICIVKKYGGHRSRSRSPSIRYVVFILAYGIRFLRHMTSYITCFVKWSISDLLTTNLAQWCIRPHKGHKANYVVIGAIKLPLW